MLCMHGAIALLCRKVGAAVGWELLCSVQLCKIMFYTHPAIHSVVESVFRLQRTLLLSRVTLIQWLNTCCRRWTAWSHTHRYTLHGLV